jgi:hypothetical protein
MIIDVANEIYTKLKTDIADANVFFSYPTEQPEFPCIVFEELRNATDLESVDSAGEQINEIIMEINIFTTGETKRTLANSLRSQVDLIMSDYYNCNRGYSESTVNYLDDSIYRYTLRYDFKIDKNKKIYRR